MHAVTVCRRAALAAALLSLVCCGRDQGKSADRSAHRVALAGVLSSHEAPCNGSESVSSDGNVCYRLGAATDITSGIEDATAEKYSGDWSVKVALSRVGGDALRTKVRACVAKDTECATGTVAVLLDDSVIWAAAAVDPNLGNQLTISRTSLSKDEARSIAAAVSPRRHA